jgi:hypothetical protein
MRHRFYFVPLIMALAVSAGSSSACRVMRPFDPTDVKRADTVVIGRISHYRIVLDRKVRARRKAELARPTGMSPEWRRSLVEQKHFETDTARFDIQVDTVLVGQPVRTLTATMGADVFGDAGRVPAGPILIALKAPEHRPANSASAEYTVLAPVCSGAFIFEAGSPEAEKARQVLRR